MRLVLFPFALALCSAAGITAPRAVVPQSASPSALPAGSDRGVPLPPLRRSDSQHVPTDTASAQDGRQDAGPQGDGRDGHHRRRHRVKELLKQMFDRCGTKLRRIRKKITAPVDKQLKKLSDKEKKLHAKVKEKIHHMFQVVGSKVTMGYMMLAVALEPVLGDRLVYKMDRAVGGMVIVGKAVGRFVIDHMAELIGIGVGLLVSLTLSAGLTSVTMNPVVAGAIGGAVGAVTGVLVTHFVGAVMRGNLVPTSLHEAAVRGGFVAAEATVAGALGAGVGALTAGIAGGFVGGAAAEEGGKALGTAAGEMGAHVAGHFAHEIAMKPVKKHLKEDRDDHLERDRQRDEMDKRREETQRQRARRSR